MVATAAVARGRQVAEQRDGHGDERRQQQREAADRG